jgi:hypothetical protein
MNGEEIAYKLGFGARRRAEVDAQFRERYATIPQRPPTVKAPLTSGQHILHLLLSVFTLGLWIPVWVIRAAQGNQVPVAPVPPSWAGQPPQQWQQPHPQQWPAQQQWPGAPPQPPVTGPPAS